MPRHHHMTRRHRQSQAITTRHSQSQMSTRHHSESQPGADVDKQSVTDGHMTNDLCALRFQRLRATCRLLRVQVSDVCLGTCWRLYGVDSDVSSGTRRRRFRGLLPGPARLKTRPCLQVTSLGKCAKYCVPFDLSRSCPNWQVQQWCAKGWAATECFI